VAPESTDIRNALHSVTRMLTAEANKAGVALTTDIDAWLPAIETDARRLRQVLINLVGNAIKFTPSGGRILVKAASVAEQECLKLSVNDTGVGIAQTDLDEVVKPFGGSKAQARKSIEGSGLGLSIAKLMVERLGGKFGIDSTQGAGTEVTLTLPLKWQGPGFGRESTPPPN
jgi:signal transduction histidine kinase